MRTRNGGEAMSRVVTIDSRRCVRHESTFRVSMAPVPVSNDFGSLQIGGLLRLAEHESASQGEGAARKCEVTPNGFVIVAIMLSGLFIDDVPLPDAVDFSPRSNRIKAVKLAPLG